MAKKIERSILFFLAVSAGCYVYADGSTIDRVYHPYVQLLEKEIEYRVLYEDDSNDAVDGRTRHKLGYGQSISDQFFVELYVAGADEEGDSLELESYEAELKWQLTEQGEYGNDWGLLFELEKEHGDSIWECEHYFNCLARVDRLGRYREFISNLRVG